MVLTTKFPSEFDKILNQCWAWKELIHKAVTNTKVMVLFTGVHRLGRNCLEQDTFLHWYETWENQHAVNHIEQFWYRFKDYAYLSYKGLLF